MDLGRKMEAGMPAAVGQTDGPMYPNLTLYDEQVEELLGECPVEVGDTITAMVTLKVSGMSENSSTSRSSRSLSFDAMALDDCAKADGKKDEKTKPNYGGLIAKVMGEQEKE